MSDENGGDVQPGRLLTLSEAAKISGMTRRELLESACVGRLELCLSPRGLRGIPVVEEHEGYCHSMDWTEHEVLRDPYRVAPWVVSKILAGGCDEGRAEVNALSYLREVPGQDDEPAEDGTRCWVALEGMVAVHAHDLVVREEELAVFCNRYGDGLEEESSSDVAQSSSPPNRAVDDVDRRRRDATLGLLAKMYCEARTRDLPRCPDLFKGNLQPNVGTIVEKIMDRIADTRGADAQGYKGTKLREFLAPGWPLHGRDPVEILAEILEQDLSEALHEAGDEGFLEDKPQAD